MEAQASAYVDRQLEIGLGGGFTTSVRYEAGPKNPRWILSGLASDELPDDCENGDTDGP
jgi:hypothetical protein